jgi:quercetin dioxygenase-like cupin family protein
MDDPDQIAAAFVFGLMRGAERQSVEYLGRSDNALAARIEHWQTGFLPLDAVDSGAVPRPGLLDAVLTRIDAAGATIPGTFTKRAGEGAWVEMSPGVTAKVLRDDSAPGDSAPGRHSVLIRMLPGAIYAPHDHESGDEECFVIEGSVVFGDLTLSAGDYHVAQRGTLHPAAFSQQGCLLHITTVS